MTRIVSRVSRRTHLTSLLTLWPPKFTARSERNVFPSSFSFFLFFLLSQPLGQNTSLLPCRSNTSSAQGASGKRGPDLLALFERRDVSSPNNASAPKGVPCRRRALFVIMATKLNKPSNCRRSFACKMLVWSSSSTWPGKAKSLLRKT